ncbi:MAG: carbohydrate ABC transporter permease [Candidatus Sumerlaeaceae bacterium]
MQNSESRRGYFTGQLAQGGSYYLLLLPTYILLSVFTFIPFVWAFSTSMYEYEVGGEPRFLGLANYAEYFSDVTFWPSMWHMLFLTVFAVVVNIVFPLTIAKLIFSLSSERSRYIYRILFLIPLVIPSVAQQLIWKAMIYSDTGMLNDLLRLLGKGEYARSWLWDPKTSLVALAFTGFPFANGINILIFYAGLTAISESVHEAAWMDGARGIGKFLRIDVPLVLSQVKLLVILTIIAGVQAFEGVFLMTRGGPGFETMVPGMWMYFNAFSFQRMGYACAIGVVLFVLILGLTILNARYFKSAERLQAIR